MDSAHNTRGKRVFLELDGEELFLSLTRSGGVFVYGREFPCRSLFWAIIPRLACSHSPSLLSLRMPPSSSSLSFQLTHCCMASHFHESWLPVLLSPPGQLLFQLCGVSLCFPGQRNMIALWSTTISVLGTGAITQGPLHHLAGTHWRRAPWQTLSQAPPSSVPQGSACCTYLHYLHRAASLRSFWILSLS